MITLHKATYCEECPEFEAETERTFAGDMCIQTRIYCKHSQRCRNIYKYIKEQAEREAQECLQITAAENL